MADAHLTDVSFTNLHLPEPLENWLLHAGRLPLPPYIQREPGVDDAERYQTVYAARSGAVAAPTASLHFDEAILAQLHHKGVEHAESRRAELQGKPRGGSRLGVGERQRPGQEFGNGGLLSGFGF